MKQTHTNVLGDIICFNDKYILLCLSDVMYWKQYQLWFDGSIDFTDDIHDDVLISKLENNESC